MNWAYFRNGTSRALFGVAIFVVCALTAAGSNAGQTSNPHAAEVAPSGFIESDGFRIHYESFGEGYPLVLVHGWGADTRRNWVEPGFVEAFKTKRLLISIEPRGFGQSDKPHDAAAYSYSAMSRDVLALMDQLHIEKADFMGYSMGAFMGAYLLGHHTDRFSSMILGGIGDETDESKNACYAIAQALRTPDPAAITDPLGRGVRAFVDADANRDLESLALSALQMWPEGYPVALGGEGLGRVKIPVLIVNGTEDHPYIDTVGPLIKAVPGARLVTIPGADHLGAVGHPKFREAVLEFLSRH